jgi:hypothetical protein
VWKKQWAKSMTVETVTLAPVDFAHFSEHPQPGFHWLLQKQLLRLEKRFQKNDPPRRKGIDT